MKASYYQVEGRKLNDFLIRRRNYQKHLERLRDISGKKVQPTHPDMHHSGAFNEFKVLREPLRSETGGSLGKVWQRLTQERRREILEYNSKVFDRLVDISGRKPVSSFEAAPFQVREHHNSYYNQKQFFRKVNAENSTLVHRIMTQVSPLSHKKQQEEFMETRRLKERLQRFPFVRSIDKKLEALYSIGEKEDRVFYGTRKKSQLRAKYKRMIMLTSLK